MEKRKQLSVLANDKNAHVVHADCIQHTSHSDQVLLVEDQALASRMVVQCLLHHGIKHVDIAMTAENALTQALAKSYGLILMDIGLPNHDGIWATQQIRANQCYTPIVALSAHINTQIRKNCLDAGMQAALCKPLTTKLIETFLLPYLLSIKKEQGYFAFPT